MKDFDKFIEEAALKRCPPGKYYDGNKCVIPPRGYHDATLKFLEEIIKNVSNRTFQIKNAIEWNKFQAGM